MYYTLESRQSFVVVVVEKRSARTISGIGAFVEIESFAGPRESYTYIIYTRHWCRARKIRAGQET